MDRYTRHSVLPWFGSAGQEKLRKSSVLLVGCGGLGCVCSSFIARAGVRRLRIVDPDVVSLTDLHRQLLYIEDDIDRNRLKPVVAAERLTAANQETEVEPKPVEFNARSAVDLIDGIDLLIDCTDNFQTRMLINDVCLKYSKPWIHGACVGTSGIVIPFPGGETACYRCIVKHIPDPGSAPVSEEIGILGPVAGVAGCLEAAEAIKLLVDPERVRQRIIYYESVSYTYECLEARRKADCPACVGRNYEFLTGPPGC